MFSNDGECISRVGQLENFEWGPNDTRFKEGQHDVFLVVLQKGSELQESAIQTDKVCGLVFMPAEGESTKFERAGMFHSHYDARNQHKSLGGKIAIRSKEATEQTIIIII